MDMLKENPELLKAVNDFVLGKNKEEAFSVIYRCTEKYLYLIINKSTQNESLTQDLLQDTYLSIYKNLGNLQNITTFQKWIGTIAINNVHMHYRKTENTTLFEDIDASGMDEDEYEQASPMPLPEDIVTNRESQKYVWRIINSLPEKHRQALVAFYFNEMSIKEISQSMEVPENTIKTYLSRGKKKMKEEVLELERTKGIKLSMFAFAPIMLSMFGLEAKACELPAGVSQSILSHCLSSGNGSTVTSGTVYNTTNYAGSSSANYMSSPVNGANINNTGYAGASRVSVPNNSNTMYMGGDVYGNGMNNVATQVGGGVAKSSIATKVAIGITAAVLLISGLVTAIVVSQDDDTEEKQLAQVFYEETSDINGMGDENGVESSVDVESGNNSTEVSYDEEVSKEISYENPVIYGPEHGDPNNSSEKHYSLSPEILNYQYAYPVVQIDDKVYYLCDLYLHEMMEQMNSGDKKYTFTESSLHSEKCEVWLNDVKMYTIYGTGTNINADSIGYNSFIVISVKVESAQAAKNTYFPGLISPEGRAWTKEEIMGGRYDDRDLYPNQPIWMKQSGVGVTIYYEAADVYGCSECEGKKKTEDNMNDNSKNLHLGFWIFPPFYNHVKLSQVGMKFDIENSGWGTPESGLILYSHETTFQFDANGRVTHVIQNENGIDLYQSYLLEGIE